MPDRAVRSESARRVEAFIVPELVRVIHPIFYPVEQHDRAVHRRNQAKMTEVARKAWHAFVKLRFWSSL